MVDLTYHGVAAVNNFANTIETIKGKGPESLREFTEELMINAIGDQSGLAADLVSVRAGQATDDILSRRNLCWALEVDPETWMATDAKYEAHGAGFKVEIAEQRARALALYAMVRYARLPSYDGESNLGGTNTMSMLV